eukprot:4619049-Pyramimonas_sp.AAC.1
MGCCMEERSQMRAWLSSPAVQMWQEECGAHASELTHAWCRCSSATGIVGYRMSSTTTCTVQYSHSHSHSN